MSNNYEDTKTMMNFTEILKNEPKKAYDFICANYHIFSKDKLAEIIKELLYSLHYHVDNNFYGDLYNDILTDVQIELDETYDEEYQEYGLLNEKKYEFTIINGIKVNLKDYIKDENIIKQLIQDESFIIDISFNFEKEFSYEDEMSGDEILENVVFAAIQKRNIKQDI